jgi:hypothetical protein
MLKQGLLFIFALGLMINLGGCGGSNTEKDANPNPDLEFSKEGPKKRAGGVPATTPKGAKIAPDANK